MKRIAAAFAILLSTAYLFSSCGPEKSAEQETTEMTEEAPPVELFLTSCEGTDSMLCDRGACKSSNCGIEDFYFTEKGNVIQRVSCADEEDALWVIGKYRVADSGMVCQMDRVYIVSLKKQEGTDTVNYDKGEYTSLGNKEPFLLEKSSCEAVAYTKRYSDEQRMSAPKTEETIPFGRMYYEDKARAEKMLMEMRKVKALREL